MPSLPLRKSDDLLQSGGLLVWGMVGASAFLGRIQQPARVYSWIGLWLLFGLIHASFRDVYPRLGSALQFLLPALEAACVVAMVLVRCDGFEGALLVLVAMQLGPRLSIKAGFAWITLQSLGCALAIDHHWTLNQALMLSPPYFGFQVLAFMTFRLVEQETSAREALKAAQELLLHRHRMAERVRIAGELHDALGHRITALNLNLEVATHAEADHRLQALETASSIGRGLMRDLRRTMDTLHPPPGADLAQDLRNLVVDFPQPRIHLEIQGPLPVDIARSSLLLRCAQELITNAVRHASAAQIWIQVQARAEGLCLMVRDDGIGATRLVEGRGLRSMRERVEAAGGTLALVVEPGQGLAATLALPMNDPPA